MVISTYVDTNQRGRSVAFKTFSRRVLAADGAITNQVIIAGEAGTKIHLHRLTITADGDNSVKPNVTVGFALSASGISTGNVSVGPNGVVVDIVGMAAGSIYQASGGHPTGPLGISGSAEALKFTCEAPTGGGISIVGTYENLYT